MEEKFFNRRKLIPSRLVERGFQAREGDYVRTSELPEGAFLLRLLISEDGRVDAHVIDRVSGDEYMPFRVSGAAGAFVGRVRAACEKELAAIAEACFEPDVFKSESTLRVIEYVRLVYRDELQFLWTRFPDNAVFRRRDSGKWYGAILTAAPEKLGLPPGEKIEIIDLRIEPEKMPELLDGKQYFPGYHMNKKHWITIPLTGVVPVEEICRRIDDSYRLALR